MWDLVEQLCWRFAVIGFSVLLWLAIIYIALHAGGFCR
jgi:hypothetical protein